MNSWKLNSQSSYYIRCLIANYFNIPFEEVYKKVKTIESKNTSLPRLLTKEGKIYEITLKEIK